MSSSSSLSSLTSSLDRLFSENSRLFHSLAIDAPALNKDKGNDSGRTNGMTQYEHTNRSPFPETVQKLDQLISLFNVLRSSFADDADKQSKNIKEIEENIKLLKQEQKRNDDRMNALEARLDLLEHSSPSSRSVAVVGSSPAATHYQLFIKAQHVPLKGNGHFPIVALFIQSATNADEYSYLSQTEWLKEADSDPQFEQPLEFALRPEETHDRLLKINLYDVASEQVSDGDRLGSVLVRLDDLTQGGEVLFQLEHEITEKAQAIKDAIIVVECVTDHDQDQDDHLSDDGASRALHHSKSGLAPLSQFLVACKGLPGQPNAMVAAFMPDADKQFQLFAHTSAVNSSSPHFPSPLSLALPALPADEALIKFSVFDCAHGAADLADDSKRIGSVVCIVADLLAGEAEFDLLHEEPAKQERLKREGATIVIEHVEEQESEEEIEDDNEDEDNEDEQGEEIAQLGEELRRRLK